MKQVPQDIIGAEVDITTAEGLIVACRVTNAKKERGTVWVEVTPIAGAGETWVRLVDVTLTVVRVWLTSGVTK